MIPQSDWRAIDFVRHDTVRRPANLQGQYLTRPEGACRFHWGKSIRFVSMIGPHAAGSRPFTK
jgi:hypothetical protein